MITNKPVWWCDLLPGLDVSVVNVKQALPNGEVVTLGRTVMLDWFCHLRQPKQWFDQLIQEMTSELQEVSYDNQ